MQAPPHLKLEYEDDEPHLHGPGALAGVSNLGGGLGSGGGGGGGGLGNGHAASLPPISSAMQSPAPPSLPFELAMLEAALHLVRSAFVCGLWLTRTRRTDAQEVA